MASIFNNIAKYRQLKGWSQKQLAQAVGVPLRTIKSNEEDYQDPKAWNKLLIARALGAHVMEIFPKMLESSKFVTVTTLLAAADIDPEPLVKQYGLKPTNISCPPEIKQIIFEHCPQQFREAIAAKMAAIRRQKNADSLATYHKSKGRAITPPPAAAKKKVNKNAYAEQRRLRNERKSEHEREEYERLTQLAVQKVEQNKGYTQMTLPHPCLRRTWLIVYVPPGADPAQYAKQVQQRARKAYERNQKRY